MTIGSLVVIRGTMSVTSIRLDLDGFRIDDVLDLLVTSGLVVVADVLGINVSLGVVTFTSFVLAVVGVVVIVIHAPVKVVVGGVLKVIKYTIKTEFQSKNKVDLLTYL